jgi:acyl-[acyl-carrier-protein]-phospholipid O-acyltransferase / long-chain-fatty-acid--[acyl-carrier-protein] ligase
MRWFFKPDFRSLRLLNATQFLGALNDNIFKLLVIYLLINVKGASAAPRILSLAGAIFVIPFLFVSAGAGVLADRLSKRKIIVATKGLELIIMLFGLLMVLFQSELGLYLALFCMAGQSALFGPSKYGIIPELVEPKMVSKANGSITSLTYLAIIAGTFLASLLTDITSKNFGLVSGFCIFIAILGLLTSLGIRKTAPQGSPKKINPFFLYEIYQTLKFSWTIPHLLPAILGSAFFLFIGAFTQLNIIPFAIQELHLSEVGGGYLFLPTAVGIAIGAILAGQVSKDRVEPGISCICGVMIGLLFLLLWIFAQHLIFVLIISTLLGMFGGAFLIPFDAFIQLNSPDEKRGQVIATSSFLSFVGVLMASLCLFLISEELGFSAASGFAFMGVLTLIAMCFLTGRLSGLFFPFFVRKILKRFRTAEVDPPFPSASAFLVLQSNSWWDALLLYGIFPKLTLLIPSTRSFPWINGWFETIRLIPPEQEKKLEKLLEEEPSRTYCLFFRKYAEIQQLLDVYLPYLEKKELEIVYARGKKEKIMKRFLFWHYPKKHIVLTFSQKNL